MCESGGDVKEDDVEQGGEVPKVEACGMHDTSSLQ